MKITNTWFTENGIRKKLTFARDNCKTAIDFLMVQKSERSMVTEVNVMKVITTASIPQHKLLICEVKISEKTVRPRQALIL